MTNNKNGKREPGETENPAPLRYETSDGVAIVTLDRPAAANALDGELKKSLLATLRSIADDESVRAALLTGSGKAFCVGQDLSEHAEALAADPETALDTVRDEYNPIASTLSELPKPVVVAINGACVGAGLGFALAGDIRVAAESAKFGTAFTGIGLASDSALTAHLVHALGVSRATRLFMLGEVIPASQALDWGLVHQVVPDDDCASEAFAVAKDLAQGPTRAYAELKVLLRQASNRDLADTLEAEAHAQRRLGKTADHRNAVNAFLNKRRPEFEGR